jgi:uncharacterized protein (TIGR02246 family)
MSLILAMALAAGMAGGEEDRHALLRMEDDFAAAWNRGDAAAMAALWTEEGDFISPGGKVARGRTGIERMLREEQAASFKDTRMAIACPNDMIRFVTSDVATIDCTWVISGARDAGGQPRPPLTGRSLGVALKADGRWRWTAGRAFVPLPPLPPPPPPKP